MSRPHPTATAYLRVIRRCNGLAPIILHAVQRTTSRPARWLGALFLGLLVGACSTAPPGESFLDKTLGLVGLQKMEAPAAVPLSPDLLKPPQPTKMPLRIHASDQLNSDGSKRALSLVVKIYKLKGHEDFLRTPYKSFSQAPYSHEDVISTRELVLLPGQRYEVEETLPKDATHLGVVALFKSPEEFRWRFVFDVASNAKQGITLGAHQCALSVSQGETVGSPPEARRLAGAICR